MTTPSGIWLVARQEFRMRLRTGRWKWLLGGWLVLLAVFTGLLDLSVSTGYGYVDETSPAAASRSSASSCSSCSAW